LKVFPSAIRNLQSAILPWSATKSNSFFASPAIAPDRHHDLFALLRAHAARAGLSVPLHASFNPKPRCIFALPLPLGVVGSQEVVTWSWTIELPLGRFKARLTREALPVWKS